MENQGSLWRIREPHIEQINDQIWQGREQKQLKMKSLIKRKVKPYKMIQLEGIRGSQIMKTEKKVTQFKCNWYFQTP